MWKELNLQDSRVVKSDCLTTADTFSAIRETRVWSWSPEGLRIPGEEKQNVEE